MSQPEVVHIVWRSADGKDIDTKVFMLDCGRLQLTAVKQAFGLSTVELMIGKPMQIR